MIRRVALLVATLVPLAACHRGGRTREAPIPVAGSCGQRSAVALYRGAAPRRAAGRPGALVVRVAPADSGLTPPEGPVRLYAAASAAGGAAQLLPMTGRVARTGPLAAGRYVLEAAGTGYQPRRLTVSVRPGATDTVRFRLAAMCVRRSRR